MKEQFENNAIKFISTYYPNLRIDYDGNGLSLYKDNMLLTYALNAEDFLHDFIIIRATLYGYNITEYKPEEATALHILINEGFKK